MRPLATAIGSGYDRRTFGSRSPVRKGDQDMTKAKARARAKAKAGQKAKKRAANAAQPEPTFQPGKFDPGTHGTKRPGMNVNTKNIATAKRGAARSN